MDIEAEVSEYRDHVRYLGVEGHIVSVVTLENIEFKIEVTAGGYNILSSSLADLSRSSYDDLNQLLTSLSSEYRNSISQSLFTKLQSLSNL